VEVIGDAYTTLATKSLEPPHLPFSKNITENLALILLKKFESTGKIKELTGIQ
jgi:hypothetical protein